MPSNPMWDWPTTAVIAGTFTLTDVGGYSSAKGSTTPTVETKRTFKCVNPQCWVTKITVEWE